MDLAELKRRIDLRTVIPSDEAAQEHGRYRSQRCLFHSPDDDSLLVYSDGYVCQSCGVKGDVIDWLQFSERLTYQQAIAWLEEHADAEYTPPPKSEIKTLDESLANWYHTHITQHALDYYHSRGLSDETILHYRLGYGVPPSGKFPRFSIPIFHHGSLVNIKFRRDDTNTSPAIANPQHPEPKYIGIKGHSTPVIFGDIAAAQDVLIVEGEFDAMICCQNGINAVTSTGGAGSWQKEWSSLFATQQRLYACYDNDSVGKKAMSRLRRFLPTIRPVTLYHDGKDLTDFLLNHTVADLHRVIQEAERRYQWQKQGACLKKREQAWKTKYASPWAAGNRK